MNTHFLSVKVHCLINTIHGYEGKRSSPGFTSFWIFELRSFLNMEISVQFLSHQLNSTPNEISIIPLNSVLFPCDSLPLGYVHIVLSMFRFT